jgi:two-component system sensor histidine kinase KdpD
LIDNAAKYSFADTPIRIGGHLTGDRAVVTVADQGSGIPDGDLERIFDKFYRVRTADRQRAGSGLGLAISRGFVESMGGTIAAANRIDCHGAIFTVTLPLAPARDMVLDDLG